MLHSFLTTWTCSSTKIFFALCGSSAFSFGADEGDRLMASPLSVLLSTVRLLTWDGMRLDSLSLGEASQDHWGCGGVNRDVIW
jgi:hypothetical protein